MGVAALVVVALAVTAIAAAALWGGFQGVVRFGRGVWRMLNQM
ncbi:MAG: hypothetical protein Q7T04_03445 [Dehalococcoidia bacterium]|nr:hypothetical protein [Dehalococcoidia bacterium]